MLRLRTILIYISLLLFTLLIHAQDNTVSRGHTGNAGTEDGSTGSFITPIPGGPISADVIDETDRILADGTHIHQESHGKLFFDSERRLRVEENKSTTSSAGDGAGLRIMINDTVAGRLIFLDPEHKTARVILQKREADGDSTGPISVPRKPVPVENRGIDVTVENLGTKTMEGFTVVGHRAVKTIAAGTLGNDKPIIATGESWYSKDLAMDLFMSTDSPDKGRHVHKFVNIRAGNPDSQLFQIPADFKVIEVTQQ